MPKSAPPPDPIRKLRADQSVLEAQRLREAGKITEASTLAYAIVQAEPDHVGAIRLMGLLAMQTGAADIAADCFGRALSLAPRSVDILVQLGDALLADHRPAEAGTAFRQALAVRDRESAAWRGLGQAQLDLGDRSGALKSFRRTLALLPYDSYAAHMIAGLTAQPERAAATYVPTLFDKYADIFDEHLTETLHYRIPQAIADLLAGQRLGNVLDLGCGTGLVGAALADRATAIDGIDIAPQMTSKAAERSVYRLLRTGDAVDLLATDPALAGPYDLVTAADVFIYIGALDRVFPEVARVLRPSGQFVFSVETVDGTDVAIRSSGRFAHPDAYITRMATVHGFTILTRQDEPIRHERNQPIPGRLYLLQRNA